jgi:hypothetical protein
VLILETVHDISRVADPEVSKFMREKFWVRMSRQAFNLLKFQVDFNQLHLILYIMNLNLHFEITSTTDLN